MTRFGTGVLVLILIVLVGIGYLVFRSPNDTELAITNFEECVEAGNAVMESYPRQCRTEDGKLFVEEIEDVEEERVAAGYVSGHVTIGPICPVEREGEQCVIPPETYTSREVLIYSANQTTVLERGKLDALGNYKMALQPGSYYVQISPAGIGPGEKKAVTVKSFETAVVNFDIDTGIR